MNIKQSVIKSKQKEKKPLKIAVKSLAATQNNLNRQLAESVATFYSIAFTKYQNEILNTLLSMLANHKYELIVPSQGWMARQIGCDIRTVRTAMKLFHTFGIINKTSRGWRVVRKDFFRAMTCKYSQGKSLVKDMNFINTYLPKASAAFTTLWERIPALAKMFPLIFLVTSLVNYESDNISLVKYIRSSETTFFGQSGYEVSKNYAEKKILPTISVPVDFKQRIKSASLPKDIHPGNVYDAKHDHYHENNIRGLIQGGFFLKREIDSSKTILNFKEFSMLTQDQVSTIKSFPPEIVQYARKCLNSFPERKNDFQWIYKSCIAECKVRNLPIKETLSKYGYNSRPKTFKEKQATNSGYLSRQPYHHQEQMFSQPEANADIQKIMDDTESFNKMVALMGEKAALMYQKKMIDNIIDHID